MYVLALIIDALGPSFGGTKNQVQALEVVAYPSTASRVAGMRAPAGQALGYAVVVVIAAIVLYMAIAMLAASFMRGPLG